MAEVVWNELLTAFLEPLNEQHQHRDGTADALTASAP